MQALYSSEDMTALDPMTLQPVFFFNRKIMDCAGKNPAAPISELGKQLLMKSDIGDTEKVRELMAKGAPFTTDWLGTSPLHLAAQKNHIETVEVLLRSGISRDAKNKVERTPLHVASQEGYLEIVNLLIEYGADVDCKDMLRMTPLHWAAENGHDDCVRTLLKNGADPTVINKFDKSPDQIAFDNHRLDIVQMIQQIVTMDPMSRPKKLVRKEHHDNKSTMHTPQSLNNLSQESVDEIEIICDKSKTKNNVIKPNSTFNKHPVTEIRVMKMSAGKKKVFNNQIVEEAQIENEMATIPNPTDKTLQLLQEHGIRMLPVEDNNLVASAMQSGQTVVLTEAGKLALNQTSNPTPSKPQPAPTAVPVPMPKTFPLNMKGMKVIKVRADQLINMTKEKKVIIHTDKKFKLNPKRILDTEEDAKLPAVNELEAVQKQLEEMKKQVEMYKEQFLQKEKEAEHYKSQLESFILGK